jgi:hypothetical protein
MATRRMRRRKSAIVRSTLPNIRQTIEELSSAHDSLRHAKATDADIGTLTTLCTRVKIYIGCKQLLRQFRQGEMNADSLQQVLQRIKLHRYQLRKMGTLDTANHRYLVGLAALLHICFG